MIIVKSFDLIVIGGGTAGMNLVYRAAGKDWKVAVIESSYLGGTCVNVGCIPSKTLLHSGRVMQKVRDAGDYGIIVEAPRVDWPAVVRRKDRLVGRIRSRSYDNVERNENITLIEGEAEFIGPRAIEVNGEKITAAKIVIAAGARTAIPQISGLDRVDYLNSTSFMDMQKLPHSLLILGGGIIALEFSQLFARLGVDVTILQRGKRLVKALEPEISDEICSILEGEGVVVKTNTEIIEVGNEELGVYVVDKTDNGPVHYRAEKLLLAAGRTPNSDRLKVERAGIEIDEGGFVKVDSNYKTTAEGIWAIGDVIGGMMFTHVAWHDAFLLSGYLLNGREIPAGNRLIPFAIFTEPEISGVGMGEEEANKAGYEVKIQRFYFAHHGRALAAMETKGFVKLVIDKTNEKILGAHIIGPSAGEIIHELVAAIRFGASVYDLQEMMHIHPTLTEAINSAAWSG